MSTMKSLVYIMQGHALTRVVRRAYTDGRCMLFGHEIAKENDKRLYDLMMKVEAAYKEMDDYIISRGETNRSPNERA